MDVTDDVKKQDSNPPQPCVPQMVITSADDTSKESCNITECTLVLTTPASATNGSIPQEATEDYELEENTASQDYIEENYDASKYAEPALHTASQRPLRIDVDKPTPTEECSVRPPTPPTPPPPIIPLAPLVVIPMPPVAPLPSVETPPLPVVAPPPVVASPPSAMQRPLVFDGSSKAEVEPLKPADDIYFEEPVEMDDELNRTSIDLPFVSEIDIADSTEHPLPPKKEESSGVKTFFDSMLHGKGQESVPKTNEDNTTSPSSPKSEKSSIKKFFHSPKSELAKSKDESSKLADASTDSKELSFAKEAKQSIKAFFDGFKHESADQTDKDTTLNLNTGIDAGKRAEETPETCPSPVSPKEGKIKTFLDSFKHESSDHKIKTSSPSEATPSVIKDNETSKSTEATVETKESSFAKDAKQSIKSFFDGLKHDHTDKDITTPKSGTDHDVKKVDEKRDSSSTQSSPKESKDSGVKAFFDSFKHESSSDQKSKISPLSDAETKLVVKDSNEVVEKPKSPEKSKDSSSFAKETKQNIKAFFDTFKHDSSDQKHKDSAYKISASQPDVHIEMVGSQELSMPKGKENIKESKHVKKSFLNTFKSEPNVSKQKDVQKDQMIVTAESKISEQDPGSKSNDATKVHSSFAKDTKQNIKTFFGNLKHDKQKDMSQELPTQSEPNLHSEAETTMSSPKNSKSKGFLANLKHGKKQKEVVQELPAQSEPNLHEQDLSSASSVKSSRHPLKRLFSRDTQMIAASSPCNLDGQFDTELESREPAKRSKSVKLDLIPTYSMDNFDRTSSYSYINGYDSEIVNEPKERAQSVPSEIFMKSKDSGPYPEIWEPHMSFEIPKEETETPNVATDTEQHKDSFHGIKKFFGSFRHEKSHVDESSTGNINLKDPKIKVQAMDDSVLSDGEPKAKKEKKHKSLRRSLSDKVNREEMVQNFKEFFDSIGHKSSTKKSERDSEHIYDAVEVKPEISSPPSFIQTPPEPPKAVSTPKSEKTGVKRMFSSFQTTDTFPQSAVGAKQSPGSLPMIEVSSEPTKAATTPKSEKSGVSKIFSSFHTADSVSKSTLDRTKESKSKKGKEDSKSVESKSTVKQTDLPQSSLIMEEKNLNKKESAETEQTAADLSQAKPDKPSMFNSIGENIMALKDKVMHNKEKRKSNIIENAEVSESITTPGLTQQSPSVLLSKEKPVKSVEKVKPPVPEKPDPALISSSALSPKKIPVKASEKTEQATPTRGSASALPIKEIPAKAEKIKPPVPRPPAPPQKPVVVNLAKEKPLKTEEKVKPLVPEKPANFQPEKPTQKSAQSKVETIQDSKKKRIQLDSSSSPESPSSLYDTCCIRLAGLLREKAIHIVSDHTKRPPPKPPKPSAETIAKARAESVSRRLTEAKMKDYAIGENIPIGCDSLRFADDDTESSCDYKDLENFNYIIDYELLNRYKLENNLDTFSLPSTCSGLTSYYTADNSPINGSIYEAVLETISLNSDITNNFKYPPSSSQKTVAYPSSSKECTVKKVPPPVPPKPVISKIKSSPYENTVSPYINGLSLSPRQQNKFSKDPLTQKRPLMVADFKGTQFSSLPHSKSTTPKKPLRTFNTILKNESLKNISGAFTDDNIASSCLSPEKDPLHRSRSSPVSKVEKRTISPPRPPPPDFSKFTPHRQAPPVPTARKKTAGIKLDSGATVNIKESISDETTLSQSLKTEELDSVETNLETKSNLVDNLIQPKDSVASFELDQNIIKDELNINLDTEIADSLNNNVEASQSIPIEKPKPPPRNRRVRSRTVEVITPERSDDKLKRSQSLSDVDIEKRVTFLEAEKSKLDAKALYSQIKKDGKRLNKQNAQSSPDLVSGRPLPPPPPPPRKFRSLDRKSKRDADRSESPRLHSESPLRPPARRKKTEKEKFFSLRSEPRIRNASPDWSKERASSAPCKPDRTKRASEREMYDVNANISSRENLSKQSIPADSTDSINKSMSISPNSSRTTTEPRPRSNSSWYDADEPLTQSWEVVDDAHPYPNLDQEENYYPQVPVRRKSGSKSKVRESSKFYVDIKPEQTSPPPLVDKETSPLPLDCSEKSVQTSLETLPHSRLSVSHDEQNESEDTDELLDLAQTLQKELSTIINRHTAVNESSEETPSPPLSAATSERNIVKVREKTGSVRSSTSEVWPMTSSDESDAEAAEEDSSNVNEVAVKRKQKKVFYIAQEIMTSEEAFVDALKLLNVDFKAAVESSNQQRGMSILPEETLSQILNHLPQLQHLNENLLMELRDRIENWEKNGKIADIIVKMGPFLKLYSWYIHDFESNVSLLEECKRKYPAFAQTVKDFEMSPRCKRLTLNHYMLKPIQRIPQYRLLLQEYLHHLTEGSPDYQDTQAALQIVSEVANHANDSMKQGDNAQKLISIQNSILGHKEIVKPGRMFVKEGELMKLSRKGMQPRWFILFNDLLLYLTPVQQGLYRVNHELPLTGMKVAIPIQQDYQNEFSIISVTRSFTLAARSPEERQEWIVALTKAIEENASKRSTFTNTRLHQKAQDKTSSEDEAAFVLGRKAPVWIPDARVTMCQLCTSEFTVTFRRHHCRACGKVVCSVCSSHRISLPYLGNRIARVCDECHTLLGQGSSACTESGETDSENQQIAVKSHLRTDNRHVKKNKRVLPSVLKEVCANDQGSTISGYLHKRYGKSWKRDWFVVKDKVLYEYKASEDVAALRSVPLLGYQVESFSEPYENIDALLLFQLTHPGQAPILFYADTVGSTERWMSALKTATVLE